MPVVGGAGFLATDLRALLDLQGRYATAIGPKQSCLVLAFGCWPDWSAQFAVAASFQARLAMDHRLARFRLQGRPIGGPGSRGGQACRELRQAGRLEALCGRVRSGGAERIVGSGHRAAIGVAGRRQCAFHHLLIMTKLWLRLPSGAPIQNGVIPDFSRPGKATGKAFA